MVDRTTERKGRGKNTIARGTIDEGWVGRSVRTRREGRGSKGHASHGKGELDEVAGPQQDTRERPLRWTGGRPSRSNGKHPMPLRLLRARPVTTARAATPKRAVSKLRRIKQEKRRMRSTHLLERRTHDGAADGLSGQARESRAEGARGRGERPELRVLGLREVRADGLEALNAGRERHGQDVRRGERRRGGRKRREGSEGRERGRVVLPGEARRGERQPPPPPLPKTPPARAYPGFSGRPAAAHVRADSLAAATRHLLQKAEKEIKGHFALGAEARPRRTRSSRRRHHGALGQGMTTRVRRVTDDDGNGKGMNIEKQACTAS
jgi:hypothetical protein